MICRHTLHLNASRLTRFCPNFMNKLRLKYLTIYGDYGNRLLAGKDTALLSNSLLVIFGKTQSAIQPGDCQEKKS